MCTKRSWEGGLTNMVQTYWKNIVINDIFIAYFSGLQYIKRDTRIPATITVIKCKLGKVRGEDTTKRL